MKPSKLYEALHALISERVPLHIWGACGVEEVTDRLPGRQRSPNYDFLDVRAVQLDPVDLRGLPRIAADQNRNGRHQSFSRRPGRASLFLDELTSAPTRWCRPLATSSCSTGSSANMLPVMTVVVIAFTPAIRRRNAEFHFAMPRPLRNRFVHLDLEPDLDDWCRWAVKAQVRPEIIAFLRFKPELLHTADATSDANAWPTPRSWEMASQVLSGIARRQKTKPLSGTSEFEAQLLDGTSWYPGKRRPRSLLLSSACSASCCRRLTKFLLNLRRRQQFPRGAVRAKSAIATALGSKC